MKFSDNERGPYTRDAPFCSSEDELYHFGTKGMKWGRRRYQNEDGSLTEEGRRHYGYSLKRAIKNIGEARRKKKAAKKRAQALEKARKAKAEKKAHEEAKKKAVETGDATEVLKYKNELTVDEKRKISDRLKVDDELAKYAASEAMRKAEEAARNSKWNKAKRIAGKIGEAGETIEKLGNAYNKTAKVVNAFSDTKLPLIGEVQKKDPESVKRAKKVLENWGDFSTSEKKQMIKEIQDLRVFEGFASNNNPKIPDYYKANDKKKDKEDKSEKKKEDTKQSESSTGNSSSTSGTRSGGWHAKSGKETVEDLKSKVEDLRDTPTSTLHSYKTDQEEEFVRWYSDEPLSNLLDYKR